MREADSQGSPACLRSTTEPDGWLVERVSLATFARLEGLHAGIAQSLDRAGDPRIEAPTSRSREP